MYFANDEGGRIGKIMVRIRGRNKRRRSDGKGGKSRKKWVVSGRESKERRALYAWRNFEDDGLLKAETSGWLEKSERCGQSKAVRLLFSVFEKE